MTWKLKVSEYGKIKSAEIEPAPFTLFVGDNNSGKSYLMSLLWGIRYFGISSLIGENPENATDKKAAALLTDWVYKQVLAALESDEHIAKVSEIADLLQDILQSELTRNKVKLLQKIFNSPDVPIKDLQIELQNLDTVFLSFHAEQKTENRVSLVIKKEGIAEHKITFSLDTLKKTTPLSWQIVCIVVSIITGIDYDTFDLTPHIYLPSAREGLMLTKNIINSFGRNHAFNLQTDPEPVTPFTRPINQFLDVIDTLTLNNQNNKQFESIVTYLEHGMIEGNIKMSTLPNREISYIPIGQENGIPLRLVSAVVTELSPLILILKHKTLLKTLFYEEPEMCLHPQLQHKIAKVLCQLVNTGLNMTVTTHSDIILQHINNMLCLYGKTNQNDLCCQFGYTEKDLLKPEQVKVYQLKAKQGELTEVEEIICGENGFALPTFNDALDRIMDEAYAIQE